MNKTSIKKLNFIQKAWHYTNPIIGLPLLYIGTILLVLHYFLQLSSNIILIIAIVLDTVGIIAHFWKIKANASAQSKFSGGKHKF